MRNRGSNALIEWWVYALFHKGRGGVIMLAVLLAALESDADRQKFIEVYGRKNNVFDRDALTTRAEFSAMAARFSNSEYHGDKKFSDITGHWEENEIYRAAEQDWVRGFSDGTFRPERKITRAEAMAIINRVLRRVPASEQDLLPDMIVWPDNMDTSAWYYLDIQEATNSHTFAKCTDGSERWVMLLPTKDWKQYET